MHALATALLAVVSFASSPRTATAGTLGATGAIPTAPNTNYEASDDHGLQHLEHVNICIPSHYPAKHLYYNILGLAPDARKSQNIVKGSGTIWANIGTTQIHFPEGEPQVVPGTIGLVYDRDDLSEVIARLKSATNRTVTVDTGNDDDALGRTKFSWREGKQGEQTTHVDVTCPYGNVYRLHPREPLSLSTSSSSPSPPMPPTTTFTAANPSRGAEGALDPRGGRLPNVHIDGHVPFLGLGIVYVSFRVRPGTAGGIARFYREVFGAEAEEMDGGGEDGDGSCAAEGGNSAKTSRFLKKAKAVVKVGPVQHLEFVEEEEESLLPKEYDGHHICVYLTEEGFRRSYIEAERRGLVFVNPRRNFGKADTLEKALEEKQFRIKDMVDSTTRELLHVLEHEIRTVSHPSYPVGRDLSTYSAA